MGEIKHGFLAEVFWPWIEWEGTEWGEQMRPLCRAYSAGKDYALSDEQLDQIGEIIRDTLVLTLPSFIEWNLDELKRIQPEANRIYKEALNSWKARAEEMSRYDNGKSLQEYEDAQALVPDLLKPDE